MNLRITFLPDDVAPAVRLEGRLGQEGVQELERSLEPGVRVVDLDGLMSADDDGIAALRRLRSRGIELRRPPRYIELLLGDDPSQLP